MAYALYTRASCAAVLLQEVGSVPQINFLSAGSGPASSSGQAVPLSFSLAPGASPAAPVFGAVSSSAPFGALSFGPAASGTPSSFQLASSIAAPMPGGYLSSVLASDLHPRESMMFVLHGCSGRSWPP